MLFNRIRSGIFGALRYKNMDKRSVSFRLRDISSRHIELSAVYSDTYKFAKPTKRLLTIFQELISQIQSENFDHLEGRENVPEYAFEFPGEHYLALKALIKVLQPKSIIEIGTFTGLSAIAMKTAMGVNDKLTTIDIIDWNKIPDTCLTEKDFSTQQMRQIIADFSVWETMQLHADIFMEADLIFCDGPKDEVFEKRFLLNLQKIGVKDGCILFFDDIRQWNMLKIWHDIKMPKLDITSIGHFTGSGLIEWDNKQNCF